MNPGKNGWLQEYLEFRKDVFKDYQSNIKKAAHPEFALYRIIQPTGLMYGQSVSALEHPDAEKWQEKDRMKILLAENLIGSSILFYDKPIKSDEELNAVIQQTIESISKFYNHVFPELATSASTWFGKKKSIAEVTEQILEKRVEKSKSFTDNFWVNFFHNSLLFLDIYIFGQWIHTQGDKVVSDFFKFQREELRFSVVKIITSAAHANQTLEFEERKLLEYFLQSAGLSAEKKKEAREIFEKGVEIEGLDLPTNNSWILRKFFLEMAILTIWSDKQVEDEELAFLNRLAKHLNFNSDDLENSLIALEGFVLQHWDELGQLQNKKAFQQVSDQFVKRVKRVVEANRTRLIKDAQENRDLVNLLKKGQSKELSIEDKNLVRDEILTLLKSIPNFTIIALPQRFLTFPVLLKILPNNFVSEAIS